MNEHDDITVGRLFHESSNGDRWSILRDGTSGQIFVRHEPNAASGGRPTDVDFHVFLEGGDREAPECRALWCLIDKLKQADLAEGSSDVDPWTAASS